MENIREFVKALNRMIDFLPDATLAVDKTGCVIAWNQAMEDMTGVAAKDILGKGDYEYAVPFYGTRRPILVDFAIKGDAAEKGDYAFFHRDQKKKIVIGETVQGMLRGKPAYLWAQAGVIRNSKGEVIGALESVRDITDIKKTEEALRLSEARLNEQKAALEQRNIDLKDILSQVEIEKKRIQENVLRNTENILLPILRKLKLKGEAKKYVQLLQNGLEDLTGSFGFKMAQSRLRLSPREIEICNMVKNGLSGKEISRLLNLSFQTVERHRKNIRRKLGIAHRKVNLRTFLLEDDHPR